MSLFESVCTDPFTENWIVSVDLTVWELMVCTATGRALELFAIWTRLSVNWLGEADKETEICPGCAPYADGTAPLLILRAPPS